MLKATGVYIYLFRLHLAEVEAAGTKNLLEDVRKKLAKEQVRLIV